MSSEHTQVDLLRHGEHVLGEAICGVTDPELSDKGWGQLIAQIDGLMGRDQQHRAKHNHQHNQHRRWDICVSSPRNRCATFAKHISQKLNIKFDLNDALCEINFGQWEGLTAVQIETDYPGQWQQWLDNPSLAAPHGGETYGMFQQRIQQAWLQLIEDYRGKRILLLSHSGVMRVILATVLNLDITGLFRWYVPHACHSQVSVYQMQGKPDWFQLNQHNSAHLEP